MGPLTKTAGQQLSIGIAPSGYRQQQSSREKFVEGGGVGFLQVVSESTTDGLS
jgi:hypothetical protein